MDTPVVHHVGYLAANVEAAAAELGGALNLEVTRRFDRPRYRLSGVYLGHGPGNVEVFSFSDSSLVHARLAGRAIALDHVAYSVDDIRSVAAGMRRRGIRFFEPDGRAETREPIDLDGILHMWTAPADSTSLALQLVQVLRA